MTQASTNAEEERLGLLVVARLCVGKSKAHAAKQVSKDVAAVIGASPPTAAETRTQAALAGALRLGWARVTTPARARGNVKTSRASAERYAATPEGRAALAAQLGLSKLPSPATWKAARERLITPLTLGRTSRRQRQGASGLATEILVARHELDPKTRDLEDAVAQLCWRALGVKRREPFEIARVQRYLLRALVPEAHAKRKRDAWQAQLA
ncbi:MAG: hypothetical protein ABW321_08735, partial [Polyangiales bacterium]